MGLRALIVAGLVASATSLGACTYETPTLAPVIPPDAESSVVVDVHGAVVHTFHGVENRESVPLSAVPTHVREAVLAIEDARFYSHRGVDLQATIRALRANVAEGEVVQGGSTITQQYVKNALVGSDRSLDRKVLEAAVSYQLEGDLTKDEIFERYLNTVYFGAGAYGVQAAAQEMFGLDAAQLDPAQGALLAGLIRAPSVTDPFVAPERALARRDVVISRLAALGWVDDDEAADLRSAPLGLRTRSTEDRYAAPYFVEAVRDAILDDPRFGDTRQARLDLLLTGGLRIETTLDPSAQAAAERAVARVLPDPDDPDAAVVVIDPTTGAVRALVGGHDYFDDDSPTAKLNLATQGRRPTGSAFKPLVLAAALTEGIGTDTTYPAPSTTRIELPDGPWEVQNYGGVDGGVVDLVDATVWSYNTAYARLVMDVGPADATAMASRLGVTDPLVSVPSAVLGTNDVSPLALTSAYATLAAGGVHRTPTFVTRVEDRDGAVLWQWSDQPERVLGAAVAQRVTDVLSQVVGRGTGAGARIGRPVAGKTGTGQDWGDAWFIGYTPQLVTGVWVGFAEGQVSMTPPRTRVTVTGGGWPADIFSAVMTSALADAPVVSLGPADPGEVTPAEAEPGPTAPPRPPGSSGAPSGPVEATGGRAVPDVIGLPVRPATDRLVRAGLVVEVVEVPDDQYPPGVVVGSTPGPGPDRPDGGVIEVRVADGSAIPRVPDVLGLDVGVAERAIRAVGLTPEVVVQAEDDPADAAGRAGRVWKAEPASGVPVADPAAVVRLWVNPAGR